MQPGLEIEDAELQPLQPDAPECVKIARDVVQALAPNMDKYRSEIQGDTYEAALRQLYMYLQIGPIVVRSRVEPNGIPTEAGRYLVCSVDAFGGGPLEWRVMELTNGKWWTHSLENGPELTGLAPCQQIFERWPRDVRIALYLALERNKWYLYA